MSPGLGTKDNEILNDFLSAILLSGLLAKRIPFSPYSIKRALQNSALYVDSMDHFAQGSGLLQVERAFDHLVAYANVPERDVRFSISCSLNNAKGIHLRGGYIDRPKDCPITVEPIFLDSDNVGRFMIIMIPIFMKKCSK